MESDKTLSLQSAVNNASWTNNTNVNVLGFDPMSLVTGKSVTYPGVTMGNIATESTFDSDAIRMIIERHHEMTKSFRDVEYSTKLENASKTRNNKFNDFKYKENDLVSYQDRMQNGWNGPVKVLCHRNRDVFLWANGDLKKVADCKVKAYKTFEGPSIGNDSKSVESNVANKNGENKNSLDNPHEAVDV